MRAVRIEAIGVAAVTEVPDPVPGAGEALVELRASALNHRDLWIKLGQYAGLGFDEFILPDWNLGPDKSERADTLARIKTDVFDRLPGTPNDLGNTS